MGETVFGLLLFGVLIALVWRGAVLWITERRKGD
jgi:hypothetical protein